MCPINSEGEQVEYSIVRVLCLEKEMDIASVINCYSVVVADTSIIEISKLNRLRPHLSLNVVGHGKDSQTGCQGKD